MKSYSSREVLRILLADGWVIKHQTGSHVQLVHRVKPGKHRSAPSEGFGPEDSAEYREAIRRHFPLEVKPRRRASHERPISISGHF